MAKSLPRPPAVEDSTRMLLPTPVPATETALPPTPVAVLSGPNCDSGAAGQPLDVTIPDGSVLQPGQSFIKTWRLVNAGDCAWDERYALVWFSGDSLDASEPMALSGIVQPGETVELSVGMRAPELPGSYQGYWKLRNPQQELFGIGPDGQSPFWVRIEVVGLVTDTPQILAAPTETAVPFVQGGGGLLVGQGFDLDSGALTVEELADVQFWVGADGMWAWQPVNGASFGVYGGGAPSLPACREAALSADLLPLDTLSDGAYICFRSNMGLPGYLRLVGRSEAEGQVSFEFLTWLIP